MKVVALAALIGTASAACIFGSNPFTALPAAKDAIIANKEVAKSCFVEVFLGRFSPKALCGGPCSDFIAAMLKESGKEWSKTGDNFADCTGMLIGGSLDELVENKDAICSLGTLDRLCFLSTSRYTTALEFDETTCGSSLTRYACKANPAGECRSLASCPAGVGATVNAIVKEGLECLANPVGCEATIKKFLALWEIVFDGGSASLPAEKLEKAAQYGKCFYDAVSGLVDEIIVTLLAKGPDVLLKYILDKFPSGSGDSVATVLGVSADAQIDPEEAKQLEGYTTLASTDRTGWQTMATATMGQQNITQADIDAEKEAVGKSLEDSEKTPTSGAVALAFGAALFTSLL